MNTVLHNELEKLIKLNEKMSADELTFDETNDFEDRLDQFREEVEKLINKSDLTILREVVASKNWISPYGADDIAMLNDDELRTAMCNNLYEDTDFVLDGVRELLSKLSEDDFNDEEITVKSLYNGYIPKGWHTLYTPPQRKGFYEVMAIVGSMTPTVREQIAMYDPEQDRWHEGDWVKVMVWRERKL